ncbi:hypothetical protein K502DRAFT_336273 [Neoconidiobolus thromboides FSU 785]|nr:hypothetical protein K502DRAFT_336273 [Neoconidiobolus thromboides FSU 785]
MPANDKEDIGPMPSVDNDNDNDDIGPMPTQDQNQKKRKVLLHENLYLKEIPKCEMYERSYMHRDQLSMILNCPNDFIVTASLDGHIKFWKKTKQGIEFIKNYKAHSDIITGLSLSIDGQYIASISNDKSIRIFDILSFDMIHMIRLNYTPGTLTFAYKPGDAIIKLVVSDKNSSSIHIYDGMNKLEPITSLDKLHKYNVTCMAYNPIYDMIISGDDNGYLEYWSLKSPHLIPSNLDFEFKGETDLYDFKKNKSYPTNIQFSNDFQLFSTVSFKTDRMIRIFKTKSGKLWKKLDENLDIYHDLQQAGSDMYKLDPMEYGRRLVVEKEWPNTLQGEHVNAVFDYSNNFIIYPSMLGIKIINLHNNKVVRLIGKNEPVRFLNVALYQDIPQKKKDLTINMVASNNPLLEEENQSDPTLFLTAYKRNRFYLFSNRNPDKNVDRDVFNEKPSREERSINSDKMISSGEMGTKTTIHTSEGDIHLMLYPKQAPKAVLNYCTLSRKGYYDSLIFHRVIKGFMIQTGCPFGDGTGGESMFKKDFEDEINNDLNFNSPYILAMANAGPNTNGSQFFITTLKCDWLNKKHTIFGKVIGGFDVVHRIENTKVNNSDKPLEPISIISIDIK